MFFKIRLRACRWSSLRQLGNWLTEPSAFVQNLNRRRQARLLALVLLAQLVMAATACLLASEQEAILFRIFVPILMGAYIFSRTRYYLFSGVGVVLLTFIAVYVNLFFLPDYSQARIRSEAKWLGFPLLYGGLCLPSSFIFPLIALGILGILTLPWFLTGLSWVDVLEPFFFVTILALFTLVTMVYRDRDQKQIEAEQEKSEKLLLNILPEPIAAQLKESPGAIANQCEAVTILFADIVGFTPLSAQLPAADVVAILNDIFSQFDRLAGQHQLEKIKTIGDAYMVAGGLPLARADHAEAVADMALGMMHWMISWQHPLARDITLRIGIHSGPVVAGVIGKTKFSYDVWGDTVNTASRMESQGVPGKIQVSKDTYANLKEKYIFAKRGLVEVKGKGPIPTYFLLGAKKMNPFNQQETGSHSVIIE